MERKPQVGQIYIHFKNKLYQVIAIAHHSETNEKLVVYQALYGQYGVCARPYDMFISEVDHEKYPDVKQKYRFELVTDLAGINKNENINADGENLESKSTNENTNVDINIDTSINSEEKPNPILMEFLDADSYQDKYNLLVSMRDSITDKLIDDMAVVLDVVIPEGDLDSRYEALKYTIQTKQHYEYSNRLR